MHSETLPPRRPSNYLDNAVAIQRVQLRVEIVRLLLSAIALLTLVAVVTGLARASQPGNAVRRVGKKLAKAGSKESLPLRGEVRDPTGAAVVGAQVVFKSARFSAQTTTDRRGQFFFRSIPARNGIVTVTTSGFRTTRKPWSGRSREPLAITLEPALLRQTVTVTATRTPTPLGQTAADVLVLTPEEVATAPALTLDDMLRQIPGFTLFRRSGSRTANPTSQGVSLRGVGASGASRALVMADGIPLNDPFGGWVYWDRVPRAAVERVEVVRGGASDLYGTTAMGGVVNFITRKASHPGLTLDTSYGNEDTPDASLWTGVSFGAWNAALSAEAMSTEGYILVAPNERGRVDTPAGQEHETADFRLERRFSSAGSLFGEASIFRETRDNGTPLTYNRTHLRQLVFGAHWATAEAGVFSLHAYGGPQLFDQTFSAVAANRNSESLVDSQRVPAQQVGLDAQWSRALGSRQTLVAGFDASQVRGASDEISFFHGRATRATGSGGRQRNVSVFGEDILQLTPRWRATLAARLDDWKNFDALSTTRPLSTAGPVTVIRFPERIESAFSPRVATLYRLTRRVSLTASAYRAFRAPTLNELYRNFRVGNVETLANSALTAERLTGAEAGAEWSAFHRKLSARGTFFCSDISDPIANVTLSVTPSLITRERENLGRTRSRGFDLDVMSPLSRTLSLEAGYELADSTVVSFPAEPALVGRRVPEIPRNSFSFQALYSNPAAGKSLQRWIVSVQGRFTGMAFDDDLNTLPLGSFFTVDAYLARPLARQVEAYVAAENLNDSRYAIARTPVLEVGPPTLVRAGIRINLSWR